MTPRHRLLGILVAGALAACGDGNHDTPDAGPTDGGLPPGTVQLPGLDGPVEVIVDTRGMPHIYGTTRHDVIMTQAYLMAVDRYGQMEFIRHDVLGRISEVAGPDQLERDLDNRFVGYGYWGHRSYEELAADDPSRLAAEAFVEGVNVYIDRVIAGELDPVVPGAEVLNLILASPFYDHWHPGDVFAMGRYQAANLSYSPGDDINRSRRIAGVLAAFPADSTDPRLAARAGLYADWFTDRPARAVFTRDGFNDGVTPASFPLGLPIAGDRSWAPSVASLRGAERFLDRLERWRTQMWGDASSIGSNNWTVSGEHTMSGNPILANDPHLSLYSPPIWWYGHLNTTRMGATGDEAINVQGVTFGGLPGVIIGYNDHIAWGPTTTGYDVSDVYEEQLTGACDADGNVTSGTVLFNGAQVAIEFREEVVNVAGQTEPMTFQLPLVPHHGMFVPGTCAPVEGMPGHFTALSFRYTGWQTYDDLEFIGNLWTATTVEEARDALDSFRVGSQNWMVIDQDDIFWTTQSEIPTRDARAFGFTIDDEGIPSGRCPNQVLPGTGEYEWTGTLDERFIPHDQNPARGWMSTANQDNVGVTADGNPCNDPYYLGGDFDYGWREFRIQERLAELVARGNVTVDDMIDLQAETQFQPGREAAEALAAALDSPLDAIPTLSAEEVTRLGDVRDRLQGWDSYASPHGVGATDAQEIRDSIAMTLFVVSMTRIIPLALDDEATLIGNRGGTNELVRLFEWMLAHPDTLETYDATITDTVLWDDLDTPEVETRQQIVIRGVLDALTYLNERLGTDVEQWRWGRLHTVTFETLVPALGTDLISIPPENDPTYPDGFPRHGGFNTVDPGNHGVWLTTDFSHGSGPSQRMVVEMTPDGPRAFNAIPGGQDIDPESPHHDDEAAFWIANQSPPMYWTQSDIEAHVEERLSFVP